MARTAASHGAASPGRGGVAWKTDAPAHTTGRQSPHHTRRRGGRPLLTLAIWVAVSALGGAPGRPMLGSGAGTSPAPGSTAPHPAPQSDLRKPWASPAMTDRAQSRRDQHSPSHLLTFAKQLPFFFQKYDAHEFPAIVDDSDTIFNYAWSLWVLRPGLFCWLLALLSSPLF